MGPKPPESFRDMKRQESLAITGITLVAFGIRASSKPELSFPSLEQTYPSRSAFVIRTASAEVEVEDARVDWLRLYF